MTARGGVSADGIRIVGIVIEGGDGLVGGRVLERKVGGRVKEAGGSGWSLNEK